MDNTNEAMNVDDDYQDIPVDFLELFQESYRLPCNIHTLQLFVKDCLKVLPGRYLGFLSKAKQVCSMQHKSNKLTEATGFVLPAHGETRWNGQLKLLAAILKNFEEVQEKLGSVFILSDKSLVAALTHFLEPMHAMTKRIEGERMATIHHVIPNLCGIERHLLKEPQDPSQHLPQT